MSIMVLCLHFFTWGSFRNILSVGIFSSGYRLLHVMTPLYLVGTLLELTVPKMYLHAWTSISVSLLIPTCTLRALSLVSFHIFWGHEA